MLANVSLNELHQQKVGVPHPGSRAASPSPRPNFAALVSQLGNGWWGTFFLVFIDLRSAIQAHGALHTEEPGSLCSEP